MIRFDYFMRSILTGMALLISPFVFSQGDIEEPCWCMDIIYHYNTITIRNITEMAKLDSETFPGPPDCDTSDCNNSSACVWDELVGDGSDETERLQGECTTVPFSSAYHLLPSLVEDPDEFDDCKCVSIDFEGEEIVLRNVSALDGNGTYIIVDDDCRYGNCYPTPCFYKVRNSESGKWEDEIGFCFPWPYYGSNKNSESDDLLGSEDNSVENTISFFPNPAQDEITVSHKSAVTTRIYNISGQLILESTQKRIDIGDLKPGSYIITFNSEDIVSNELLIVN